MNSRERGAVLASSWLANIVVWTPKVLTCHWLQRHEERVTSIYTSSDAWLGVVITGLYMVFLVSIVFSRLRPCLNLLELTTDGSSILSLLSYYKWKA